MKLLFVSLFTLSGNATLKLEKKGDEKVVIIFIRYTAFEANMHEIIPR